jgi:hypothetical protein
MNIPVGICHEILSLNKRYSPPNINKSTEYSPIAPDPFKKLLFKYVANPVFPRNPNIFTLDNLSAS